MQVLLYMLGSLIAASWCDTDLLRRIAFCGASPSRFSTKMLALSFGLPGAVGALPFAERTHQLSGLFFLFSKRVRGCLGNLTWRVQEAEAQETFRILDLEAGGLQQILDVSATADWLGHIF